MPHPDRGVDQNFKAFFPSANTRFSSVLSMRMRIFSISAAWFLLGFARELNCEKGTYGKTRAGTARVCFSAICLPDLLNQERL